MSRSSSEPCDNCRWQWPCRCCSLCLQQGGKGLAMPACSSYSRGYKLPSSLYASTAKQPIISCRYGIHAVLVLFTVCMQFKIHHLNTLVKTSTFQKLCIVTDTIAFLWFQMPKKSTHSTSFMPSSSSVTSDNWISVVQLLFLQFFIICLSLYKG